MDTINWIMFIVLSLVVVIVYHFTRSYENKLKQAEIETTQARHDRYEDWAFTWGVPVSIIEEAFEEHGLQKEINFREWDEEEFNQWLIKMRRVAERKARLARVGDPVGLAVRSLLSGDPNKN